MATEEEIIKQIRAISEIAKSNPNRELDSQMKVLKEQLHAIRFPKPEPVPPREPTGEQLEYETLVTEVNAETIPDSKLKRYLHLQLKYRRF